MPTIEDRRINRIRHIAKQMKKQDPLYYNAAKLRTQLVLSTRFSPENIIKAITNNWYNTTNFNK